VTTEVIILAAGQGTRMQSKLPKVLHCLAGKPMLGHVIDASRELQADGIHVVIGHGADKVREAMTDSDVQWAVQTEQLGTGHAVAQALPNIAEDSTVLVAYGDVPLIETGTLSALIASTSESRLSLLTVKLDEPLGYGRIVRDRHSNVVAIVEQKDASVEELSINEVNTGILAVTAKKLREWLPKLSAENAQGEYYLTDIISMAVADGMQVVAQHPETEWEVQGVNNRQQLSELERFYQKQQAQRLMTEGATLADPARIDIRGNVSVGKDVFIDINCVFVGEVTIADDVSIGPNCVIENSCIGEGTVIKANSVLEDSQVGEQCDIGPYARLRPGTVLSQRAKIGNFVETKKALIGEGSKVNHLSYVGDSEVGRGVNIGAGTITCNYDGANKHLTRIGDGAFIGSNSALVAPVNIGTDATVGAGSTITSDVGEKQLVVTRSKQKNIDGWQRPVKNK
jgi:bifunctional UDP-N-acetylglucosamine pyrophosphorylase/glucosamine-1-phosphate N-acetyltransferase